MGKRSVLVVDDDLEASALLLGGLGGEGPRACACPDILVLESRLARTATKRVFRSRGMSGAPRAMCGSSR